MPWGAAIAAAGGIASAEINKSGQSTGGSSTSNSAETIGATNNALAKAQTIADTPFTPYTGQVVAGESAQQKSATDLSSADSAANKQASGLETAAANDIQGIKQYSADNLKQYMDPYVSAVLTPQLNQENINYNAQRSALENSKAGAFGGDRSALDAQALDKTHSDTIATAVGNANSAAYTNAQTAFFNDQSKQLTAARDLAAVGNNISQLNTTQIQNLMATGALSQVLDQKQLDFNLSQFEQAQGWSTKQLGPLLQAIDSAKGTSSSTKTYSGPSSAAGQAIGAAATIAGAYFTGGKSSSSSGAVDYGAPQAQSGSDLANPYTSADLQNSVTMPDINYGDNSDMRLKTDIVQIGYLPSGLPWYEFRYIYDQGHVHQGVIAQEAREVFPDAVRVGEDGFLRVIYSRIH